MEIIHDPTYGNDALEKLDRLMHSDRGAYKVLSLMMIAGGVTLAYFGLFLFLDLYEEYATKETRSPSGGWPAVPIFLGAFIAVLGVRGLWVSRKHTK